MTHIKKYVLLVLIWLGFIIFSKAQALKVGDQIPNFVIGKLINHSKTSIRFSEIKSRLIIIDFWSTYCTSCISHMPQMDSLQKKFGDEIFILPNTRQEEKIIKTYWSKNKYLNSTSLPTVVEDTLYQKYFPHQGVPYHIWILDGKIFAMTGGETTNQKEIRDVLDGKTKSWKVHDIGRKSFNENESLFEQSKITNGVFYSFVTNENVEYKGGYYNNFSDSTRTSTRVLYINYPIKYLYINALNFNPETRGIKQRTQFGSASEHEWKNNNGYCYEAIMPGKLTEVEMSIYMLTDLNKFFDFNGRVEKQKKEFWALTLKPGVQKISDIVSKDLLSLQAKQKSLNEKYKNAVGPVPELDQIGMAISNAGSPVTSAETLSKNIGYVAGLTVKDQTGYTAPFNITMRFPHEGQMTFEQLKTYVNQYGFDLQKGGTHEVEVFVLTDTRGGNDVK